MTRAVRSIGGAALALAGLLALLTGCADQPKIYKTDIYIPYSPTEFGYGAGRRDLTTQVRGNPFPVDQAQFDAALMDIVNSRPTFVQPTHFTTTPGDSARPAYRAVFLFDAGPPATPTDYCRVPPKVPVVAHRDQVHVVAAFCRDQGVLTTVTGDVSGVSGPDDPRFVDLMGQVVVHLFPPVDPTEDRNRLRLWLIGDDAAEPGT